MDDIAAARARLVNGTGDAIDEWRLRHGERREMVTKDASKLDLSTIYKTNAHAQVAAQYAATSDDEAWDEWFARSFDREMKAKWVDAIGAACAAAKVDPASIAKMIGDAIEPTLLQYIDEAAERAIKRRK
jgi:hypothetical protein